MATAMEIDDGGTGSTMSSEVSTCIIDYYMFQLLKASNQTPGNNGRIRKRWRVGATALNYFRRFYNHHSVIDFDPRLVLVTALLLAGKIEDDFIKINDLNKVHSKYAEDHIIACEIILINSLNFEMQVHHPQNCVHAIITELKSLQYAVEADILLNKSIDREKMILSMQQVIALNKNPQHVVATNEMTPEQLKEWKDIRQGIAEAINDWLERTELVLCFLQITDASITFSPLAIALCALDCAEPPHELKLTYRDYIIKKFGVEEGNSLSEDMTTLKEYVERGQQIVEDCESNNCDRIIKAMKELKMKNKWKEVQTKHLESAIK